MTDELPPLEHRDDPFKLLGVPTDVDERELKRAYARKIKVYRPDRAPEEFALIHAAFEHVKTLKQAMQWTRAVEEPSRSEVAAPSTTAGSEAPDESAHARAFVEAVARNDQSAAEESWAALRADGIPLEEFVIDAPPPIQAWIFESVPMTWRELSQWRDQQGAFNVWMARFARCGHKAHQFAEAVLMASEPALIADAAHELIPAVLALNAVSFIAWRDQDAAAAILRKLRSLVSHPVVSSLHDRATLDVDLAGREYRIAGRPSLPAHVLELVADWPILSPVARRELQEKLRASLVADPGEYLDHLSGTARRYRRFAEALTQRLVDGVPDHRGTMRALPKALKAKLAAELGAASRRAPWFFTLFVVLLGVVTVVGAGLALYPKATEEEGKNLTFALMFVAGAYFAAAYYLDRYFFGTKVRRLLAVAIARAGVTRAAACEWLHWNRGRAVRLFRFAPFMQSDEALRLVGMIAANVADDRELTQDQGP